MPLPSQRTGPNGELPDFKLIGPFGGIQSEMPPEQIEGLGFADAQNIMFHKARARVRPALLAGVTQPPVVRIMDLQGTIMEQDWNPADGFPPDYPAGGAEPWMMVEDFYNVSGARVQTAVTPSRLFYFDNAAWHEVPGKLTGTLLDKFSCTVVASTMCFCNGVDKVKIWDGVAPSFVDASPDAVPARYMCELVGHLVVGNTIETGVDAVQRIRWTGTGDPTDWTSLNAGQTDLHNDLGPILGLIKLFQYGFVFQRRGITQMIPTGVGTQPFDFIPLSARSKGILCPRTLSANGETTAFYVGNDNVYAFDGTSSTAIGDMPMEGRRRVGARTRIYIDLVGVNLNDVVGFVTTNVNGSPFNAYWVVIPGRSTWIYNIDEQSWTRWTFNGDITCMGNFADVHTVRIKDLIGTIAQQLWTPATLVSDTPFDVVMIGFADGTTGIFDFTGWSEEPWLLRTGQMTYGDDRHESSTKKLRLMYEDNGSTEVQLDMWNEDGQKQHNTDDDLRGVPIGGINEGQTVQKVIPVNLPGEFITTQFSGSGGERFSMSMLSHVFSPGGEVR